MSSRRLNVILFVLLAAVVALIFLVRRAPGRPNFEFIPNMTHAVPYETFAPNPNFADGKTLRQPVPGTIPRGTEPFAYGPSTEEALRAGEELSNPYALDDAAARARGANVYDNFCRSCHGGAGAGDGPVALRGFPTPPSLAAAEAVAKKDGQLFHIITYGLEDMPPLASLLDPEDRWMAVLYLRSLPEELGAPAAGKGEPGGAEAATAEDEQ